MWGRAEGKLQEAARHWVQMCEALQPPRRKGWMAAMESQGVIIGGDWQQLFYTHVNSFLTTARSVPWIIEACFGVDRGNRIMKNWFDQLPAEEQARRRAFCKDFRPLRNCFDRHMLTGARDQTVHRSGFPPVEVTVRGNFGKTYTGGPDKPIPRTEIRGIEGELAWMDKPAPVRTPMWTDFTIGGKPLFDECRAYLDEAGKLITEARAIAAAVHGTVALTPPPQ